MPKFTPPDNSSTLVDPEGNRVGTATNPLVVVGTTGGGGIGPTGDPVPADAMQVGGPDALGDLRAPAVLNSAPAGTEYGMVVRDPELLSGNALVQATGTGTAGVPAAGVVTVQGIVGGQPIPITGTISASNPSVSTEGAAVPASATFIAGEDGSGNLVAPNVATAAPVGTEVGLVVRNIPSGIQVVSGTVTASNPSVGATGAAAPTSATLIGGADASGNLVAPEVLTSDPDGTEAGLVVRTIPSGRQPVSLDADVGRWINILAQVLGQAQDPAGRLRVLIDPIGGAQSVPVTVSSGTVTTVTTLANQTSIGGNIASTVVWDNMLTSWATAVRGRIT